MNFTPKIVSFLTYFLIFDESLNSKFGNKRMAEPKGPTNN